MARPVAILLLNVVVFSFLITVPLQGAGEASSTDETVRALNNQLLDLFARLMASPETDAPALRSAVTSVIDQRAGALEKLVNENPNQALSLVFSEELLSEIASRFPEAASRLERHGSWQGTVEHIVLDGPDMNAQQSIHRLRVGNDLLYLHFGNGAPADLISGDVLEVSGVRVGGMVATESATVVTSQIMLAASTATCTPIGDQQAVVLLTTFPDVPAPQIAPSSVSDIFFGTSGLSLNEFWKENSYGQTTASGDVFGWFTLDASYACDQVTELQNAAIRAADKRVDFTRYSRLFIIFPGPANCPYAGAATVGCTTVRSNDGVTNASIAWLTAEYFMNHDQGVNLAAHEAGHNLGLSHSSSRRFSDSQTLGAPGDVGTHNEYGDYFSAMGFWNLGHYTVQQKFALGWIPSTNIQTVQKSGSYSVQALEITGATQGLRIQRDSSGSDWLWLEYRQNLGTYDSTLGKQIFNGATIRYEDPATNPRTQLLDFTPETNDSVTGFSDPALAIGRTWTDPYTNLAISVDSATASAVNVTVSYGAEPCISAKPAVTISPSNPAAYPGGSVNYSVSVTNKDSSSCPSRAFDLSSSTLSDWNSIFSTSSLTVAAGETATATMTTTVPSTATASTYSVDAAATGDSTTGDATANLTVLPLPALIVSLSVSGSRNSYPISANVRFGETAAPGATVLFTIHNPTGGAITRQLTASASGVATCAFKPSAKDPKGIYLVTATVTYGAQTVSSVTPSNFMVQ